MVSELVFKHDRDVNFSCEAECHDGTHRAKSERFHGVLGVVEFELSWVGACDAIKPGGFGALGCEGA